MAVIAIGVVCLAIALVFSFSMNGLTLSPATANPQNPIISKYADISTYNVYAIGKGELGKQILAKWQKAGLPTENIRTDISQETAGGNRVVVLFSDSQLISQMSTDSTFQQKIQQLRNSGTKFVMVSQNPDAHAAFARQVGESPQNVDFSGYKYFPLGTVCNMDGQNVGCGGVPVTKTGTYRNQDGSLDVDSMNQSILGFLAVYEVQNPQHIA